MSDSNVYTAERILAKRKHHGVTQYYIKWKGYSIKDSTWEPAENILDRGLLVAFENTTKNKASSSSNHNTTSSHSRKTENRNKRNKRTESPASATSSTSTSNSTKRGRGRPRKLSYVEQRQEQVRLQRHIELQQQQNKTHLVQNNTSRINNNSINNTNNNNNNNNNNCSSSINGRNDSVDKKQLIIFNPVGARHESEVVEEIVYEPELTKEPVLVTDVTLRDLTVTISECQTPDGFFRT